MPCTRSTEADPPTSSAAELRWWRGSAGDEGGRRRPAWWRGAARRRGGDEVVGVRQPQEDLRRLFASDGAVADGRNLVERVTEHPGQRLDVGLERVGEPLERELGIGVDRVRTDRLLEVGHEVPQRGVEATARIAVPFGQRLQADVELLHLVGGDRAEQQRLGREPAVQRRAGHARLGRDCGQGQLLRSPGRGSCAAPPRGSTRRSSALSVIASTYRRPQLHADLAGADRVGALLRA